MQMQVIILSVLLLVTLVVSVVVNKEKYQYCNNLSSHRVAVFGSEVQRGTPLCYHDNSKNLMGCSKS